MPQEGISLSGAQLLLMVEGKKGAHFSHKGMTLFLPSHSVSSLEIEDSDQLLLTLTNSEEYGFFLNITLNGQELTHISEMKIMVPYKAGSFSPVTLVGNLLENALEACLRLPKEKHRFIRINCQFRGKLWVFCLENSYDGIFRAEKGIFLTRKENRLRHGIGLESIKELVLRYEGSIDIYPLDDVFRVGIILPSCHIMS